jgi:hypothetical protein
VSELEQSEKLLCTTSDNNSNRYCSKLQINCYIPLKLKNKYIQPFFSECLWRWHCITTVFVLNFMNHLLKDSVTDRWQFGDPDPSSPSLPEDGEDPSIASCYLYHSLKSFQQTMGELRNKYIIHLFYMACNLITLGPLQSSAEEKTWL